MLFERRKLIKEGENVQLEMDTLHNILKDLKTYHVFREDGTPNQDSIWQSYDGNPQHLICISFSTIQEYCKEHDLDYSCGTTYDTGMDMCVVSKKEP